MEDLEALSSQKESKYDDDTHTSLAAEDGSYQIGEPIAPNLADGLYVDEIVMLNFWKS